jgi:hypothetical protein
VADVTVGRARAAFVVGDTFGVSASTRGAFRPSRLTLSKAGTQNWSRRGGCLLSHLLADLSAVTSVEVPLERRLGRVTAA